MKEHELLGEPFLQTLRSRKGGLVTPKCQNFVVKHLSFWYGVHLLKLGVLKLHRGLCWEKLTWPPALGPVSVIQACSTRVQAHAPAPAVSLPISTVLFFLADGQLMASSRCVPETKNGLKRSRFSSGVTLDFILSSCTFYIEVAQSTNRASHRLLLTYAASVQQNTYSSLCTAFMWALVKLFTFANKCTWIAPRSVQ